MNLDNALLKRKAIALFNFLGMKHKTNKCIGELTVRDVMELVNFLNEMEGVASHE
ncbi:MAG: hypothetical protein IJ730_04220 [Alphaproteobacteria bacterium]|nr:hypothetical protein [Alphaproteobacteria bacterium]